MSNPFADVKLPEVPAALSLWGLPGKQTARKLTSSLGDLADAIEVMSRFAGRETALTEYISDPANAEDSAVADYVAELETIGEEKSDAEAARDAAIKAANDAFDKATEGFDKREAEAETALQEAHPEIFADAPTTEENSDAVMSVDLALASIKVDVRKTIDSLKSREVKNPDYDPSATEGPASKENLTIDDVLGEFTVSVPTGKKASRTGGAGTGEGSFKPRFSKAVVDGVTLANPRVPAVAKHIGISREAFLRKMNASVSEESWKELNTGAGINFTITVETISQDGKSSETKTHSVFVIKGNAPAAS